MGVLDLDILTDKTRLCAFAVRVLPVLNSDEIDMLGQMLGDGSTNPRRIHVAVTKAGISITERPLREHLGGRCNCPPGTELKGVIG